MAIVPFAPQSYADFPESQETAPGVRALALDLTDRASLARSPPTLLTRPSRLIAWSLSAQMTICA